ncbi:MAG: DUF5666 domain-containing protein, partial [Mycobacterium sp.]
LARSVQLVALPPVVVSPVTAPSAAAEPTLVLRVAESRGDLRTVQPIVPATSSAVLPHQPGTATATDPPPPPTPTQMPTVEVTVAASAAPSRKVESQKVAGVVIEQPAADLWLVATDGCTAQKVVRVSISQISDFVGVPVLFKVVRVSGKFENAEKTAFVAAKVRSVEDGTGATESEEIGTVLALPGDGTLTLAENGRSYRFDPATVVGELKVGATVTIRYQSCGGGTPVALAVNVHEAPVEVGFLGLVADLVPNVSFTLIIDDTDPETPDRITVNYDAGTSILGLASSLANGQRVEVVGEMEGDQMRATGGIVVTELPSPLIWDPGEPPPAATFAPTPAPTSETNTQ